MCLISRLRVGEGSRCRDAIRAAGSAFTSPGISILLEVIVSGGIRSSRAPRSDPMCCALGCSPPPPRLQSPALKMLLSSSVYRQVSRRGSSYWTWGQRQGGRSILPRPTAAQPRSQRGAASAASHRTAPHGPGARSRRARHWEPGGRAPSPRSSRSSLRGEARSPARPPAIPRGLPARRGTASGEAGPPRGALTVRELPGHGDSRGAAPHGTRGRRSGRSAGQAKRAGQRSRPRSLRTLRSPQNALPGARHLRPRRSPSRHRARGERARPGPPPSRVRTDTEASHGGGFEGRGARPFPAAPCRPPAAPRPASCCPLPASRRPPPFATAGGSRSPQPAPRAAAVPCSAVPCHAVPLRCPPATAALSRSVPARPWVRRHGEARRSPRGPSRRQHVPCRAVPRQGRGHREVQRCNALRPPAFLGRKRVKPRAVVLFQAEPAKISSLMQTLPVLWNRSQAMFWNHHHIEDINRGGPPKLTAVPKLPKTKQQERCHKTMCWPTRERAAGSDRLPILLGYPFADATGPAPCAGCRAPQPYRSRTCLTQPHHVHLCKSPFSNGGDCRFCFLLFFIFLYHPHTPLRQRKWIQTTVL